MRVMVIVKASPESEAGQMPSQKILTDMGKFNEELVRAGVMLAGDGLHPSSKGKRVRFSGANRTVIDGPFTETKELLAGFWLWRVKSMDDAVAWLKRAPFDGGTEVEIRHGSSIDQPTRTAGQIRETVTEQLRLEDLDDEVADRLGNFLEPMRDAGRDDEHVSLGDVTRLPAGDVRAQPLTWL